MGARGHVSANIPEQQSSNPGSSYARVLKSSSLVGGAEAVSMVLRLVRMKFAAVLIGPLGVGLVGTYQAVQSVIGTLAGLGIQTSAVRNVAAAVERGDQQVIGETIRALRRIVWVTGILGALAMWALSGLLSEWTFGNDEHAGAIAILGLCILFGNLQGGQMALIQGMRRIGDLAKARIVTAVFAVALTVSMYLWLGMDGIVPALVGSAFIGTLVAMFYARRIPVPEASINWRRTIELSGGMVQLGLAFMWAGLLAAFVAYLARALIAQQIGLADVGIYTAAFTLSGLFVNFVLQAMSADYFPRLSAAVTDHALMRRLVNEQTEIGVLLALPGLLGTMALAPWIIKLLYTAEFLPAADLLQWFILGCLGKVIGFPMGMVLLALGKARLFSIKEAITYIIYIALIWAGLHYLGLVGTAVAFFIVYSAGVLMIRIITGYLIDFKWTRESLELIGMSVILAGIVFALNFFLADQGRLFAGLSLTLIAGIFCLRGLAKRLGNEHRMVKTAFRIPGVRKICQA